MQFLGAGPRVRGTLKSKALSTICPTAHVVRPTALTPNRRAARGFGEAEAHAVGWIGGALPSFNPNLSL
jgi:hypothetical protein